jgi:hypothetical protein
VKIALCSDEQGGEHILIDIPAAQIEELRALEIRPLYDTNHYCDGMATFQGPIASINTAYGRWGVKS